MEKSDLLLVPQMPFLFTQAYSKPWFWAKANATNEEIEWLETSRRNSDFCKQIANA